MAAKPVKVILNLCSARDDVEFDLNDPNNAVSKINQTVEFTAKSYAAFGRLTDEILDLTCDWSNDNFFVYKVIVEPDRKAEEAVGHIYLIRHSADFQS